MIDYDDLRKQCEDDIGRAHVLNATVLRLLDIIAVAKTGLEGEVCNNPTCHHDECVWSRGVLNEIAKLEKE